MSVLSKTDTFMIRSVRERVLDGPDRIGRWAFYQCPRCKDVHGLPLDYPNSQGARWDWDGSVVNPTLNPSVLRKFSETDQCHHHLHEGKVRFGGDTTPLNGVDYAGKTLDLLPLPNYWRD